METTRRGLLRGIGAACTTICASSAITAQASNDGYASFIDIAKCDGCGKCVEACRESNAYRFPEPDPAMLKPYWPQKRFEDFSMKRNVKNRLTPYNWLFVQNINIEGKSVHMPRRCMHCDNPPCAKLCPFGVMYKDTDNPVYIDTSLCFGGAKCRDVCPWSVPQRQAGVGLYTKFDPLPMGGGVMYKCDLCRDKLKEGITPACFTICPTGAMKLGKMSEMKAEALRMKESGRYIFGDIENGGTSTFYVSDIPFEKFDDALSADKASMKFGDPSNMLEKKTPLGAAIVAAPIAAAATAFVIAARSSKNDK